MKHRPESNSNSEWFGRNRAFDFLDISEDNIIRLKKIVKFLRAHKKKTDATTLLDIGGGDGRIGKKFKQLGYKVFGFDISFDNAVRADKNGVTMVTSDASETFPFQNNKFDIVFAGEIIEHLFDTSFFLTEIRRVLKKNGLLIITTPNLAHLPDRIKFLFGKSPNQVQPLHTFLRFHIRPFTYGKLSGALFSHGFSIHKLESTLVVFARNKNKPDEVTVSSKLIASIWPTMGSFLIVYAFKK